MSESASALFSIADAGEFRFARFYIVCEEVPLGTPESPLIVCGLSDTLRECPNVAKTRNGMPAAAWKKYSNFASKNLPPSVYSGTFLFSSIPVILLITKRGCTFDAQPLSLYYGFSQLSTSEFLKREMEMHETKIHLLCGWSQIVIQKNTFPLQ